MKKVIRSIAIAAAFLVIGALGTAALASNGPSASPANATATESLMHPRSLQLTSSTESTDETSGDEQGEDGDDQGEDSNDDATETESSSDDQGENSDDQGDNHDDQGDNGDSGDGD
jgi:hypothetical protein